MAKVSVLLFLSLCFSANSQELNTRPIIGILSQEPSSSMIAGDEAKNYTSYIAASYVKFMESAGARVAPIMINQDRQYYTDVAARVNGIMFPGGSNSIYNSSGYGLAGQYLYEEVLKLNSEGVYFPLWATCLGFEMLLYLSSDYTKFRISCDAKNLALPLIPENGYELSRLFSQMPDQIVTIFITENVTANFHQYCYTKKEFYKYGLNDDYQILTTDFDRNDTKFISTIEHRTIPIYGTQWHPEKNAYEWKNSSSYDSIPHFPEAVVAAQYFAEFFVNEARKNSQSYPSLEQEEESLIYQYTTKFTGNTSSFEQIYLFQ